MHTSYNPRVLPPLAPGTRLGPYEITAHIGAGGMGDVYRARDTRLDRVVALKVSKESFSDRFDREARAVATLNHPHICTLFDVGPDYLVMEYVEGTPLKGPLPLDRALAYGAQICEALDAAHRRGITHRDLKPANIIVTKSGVKLLDFGLAKIEPAVVGDVAAMTMAVTQRGEILGTLHYMSPEQLQGQEARPASDIFSFGLVLYEMITGKRAFDGSSPASVIAAILERPAPSIADIAPPALDRTLKRCLEKDPEHRWQSAADLKAELQWIASGGGEQPAVVASRTRATWWPWALAAALLMALAVSVWATRRVKPVVPTYTFKLNSDEGAQFLGAPKISPDGTKVAVAVVSAAEGTRGIEIFHLDSGTSEKIPGTRRVSSMSWSPDSRFLVFIDRLELKRVDLMGGPPTKICDFPPGNGPPFTSWNNAGTILFSGRDGLYAATVSGGTPKRVTTLAATGPQFLPDGRHFLYWNNPNAGGVQTGTIYLGSLDSPSEQNQAVVLNRASAPIFGRDAEGREYLLIGRDDALMAVRFDVSTLRPTGSPILVAPQIGMNGPVPGVSVSDNGTMVYTVDSSGGRVISQYAWFDRTGTPLATAGQPNFFREFSLSPDESQIVVAISDRNYDSEIYLMDVKGQGGQPSRITFTSEQNRYPLWSRDGTRIAFWRMGVGLVERLLKTGMEQTLVQQGAAPSDWSGDGRIVYSLNDDIMLLTDGKPSRFSVNKTEAVEQHAHLSPDGTMIAYTTSDSRSVYDIHAETVPQSGSMWMVAEGGFQPRWRSDGRELFYIRFDDAKLMAVPVTPGATIPFGAPVPLFTVATTGIERGYAVSRDGKRFLIPSLAPASVGSPINVITRWMPLQ